MKRVIIILYIIIFYSCKHKQVLPDPLEAGWNGEKVCEILHEDETNRILRCTFPPKVGHEKHYHNPHFGYAIAGSTFEITDDKETKTVQVKTGTYFSNQEIIEHQVLNVGDSMAVFLIIEKK